MVLLHQEINTSSIEKVDEQTTGAKCKQKVPSNCGHSHLEQHQQKMPSQREDLNREDNPELLLQMLIQAVKKLWMQIKRCFHVLMVDFGGYELFDRLAQWCVQHPQLAICVLAAGLVALLPIFLFMAFAFSTILMTLTGFLVLEGTLLTILTMMMLGLLGALFVMLIFFAVVGIATYFGVAQVYDMFGSTELERTTLRSFFERPNRQRAHEANTDNTGHSREQNLQ